MPVTGVPPVTERELMLDQAGRQVEPLTKTFLQSCLGDPAGL
jgi:hypothetical protein